MFAQVNSCADILIIQKKNNDMRLNKAPNKWNLKSTSKNYENIRQTN